MIKDNPEASEQINKQKAMRFGASIIIALACVLLLSLIGCTEEDSNSLPALDNSCIEFTTFASTLECGDVYMPVCGCDGNTYKNACEAMYYNGLVNFIAGACDVDDSCVVDGGKRNFDFAPVCGCDGQSYNSAEEAALNGVTAIANGLCNTIFLDVCKDHSFNIGVIEKAGKLYHWEGDIKYLSCLNCATVSIDIPKQMDLILYESDVRSNNISKIYPFSISVIENCD